MLGCELGRCDSEPVVRVRHAWVALRGARARHPGARGQRGRGRRGRGFGLRVGLGAGAEASPEECGCGGSLRESRDETPLA